MTMRVVGTRNTDRSEVRPLASQTCMYREDFLVTYKLELTYRVCVARNHTTTVCASARQKYMRSKSRATTPQSEGRNGLKNEEQDPHKGTVAHGVGRWNLDFDWGVSNQQGQLRFCVSNE